ncbi:hypothetical protein LP316_13280 [Thalassotalea sp. LPB0316]|uniref:hypothetical protein n=1 Tax=Thalassotalea sp. LPB0316 TaxID=2769490 RepID=UPI0018662A88|nr:hypothetical protein [Thalassotalea sp. LPB0316]QOL25256.1 hypothetical protein LP316_13280 [Thalassotalea sp. LPB0316]
MRFKFLVLLLVLVTTSAMTAGLDTETSILLNSIDEVIKVDKSKLAEGVELKIIKTKKWERCAEQMCANERLFFLVSENDFEGGLLDGYEITACQKYSEVNTTFTPNKSETVITFSCDSAQKESYRYLMQGLNIIKLN